MEKSNEHIGTPGDGNAADGVDTCPLVGWEKEIREDWNCFMLRPHFLDKDHRDPALPQAGNRYVLSPTVCRDLARVLLEAAEELERMQLNASPHRAN